MTEFVMPSLGADMESGTLYEWFVKPGDVVNRGDLMASVETDKGVIDIEVFDDGVVGDLLIAPGTTVDVGTPIATIVTGEGVKPAASIAQPPAEAHPMDQEAALRPLMPPVTAAKNGRRIKASPLARQLAAKLNIDLERVNASNASGVINKADVERTALEMKTAVDKGTAVRATPVAQRMAAELKIDLSQLEGSGAQGTIRRVDIERLAAAKPGPQQITAPETKATFQTRMRGAIARAMSRANTDIPHYYLETRIDMSTALSWLERENQKRSIKTRILPVVLLIKASALALTDVPELNGYWLEDGHQPQEGIHIGFAIALRQGGLVTPAIHHADHKSLDELMADLHDLITRTRNGRLRGSELIDATVTLTNLGDRGVEKVFGVIYPPQVALIGFGKIMDQPFAENGMLGIKPIVAATLAGDHRATDGLKGGQFLNALQTYLKEPEQL